jgi:ankyrin repeat protein
MSDVSIAFTLYFKKISALELVDNALVMAYKGDNHKAIEYFNSSKNFNWINNEASSWRLESYERQDAILNGNISGGTSSFDEYDFLRSMTNTGAALTLAYIYNSQVGESVELAYRGQKEAKPESVLKSLAKVDPTFALAVSILSGNNKEARKVLKQGANSNGKIENRPFIEVAANLEHLSIVKALLEHGANPSAQVPITRDSNGVGYGGETALHQAIDADSSAKMVDILLSHKADVNIQDADGNTPLHWAVLNPYDIKTIEKLIKAGGILDIYNEDGLTPFLSLLENGYSEKLNKKIDAAKLLTKHGADPMAKCSSSGNAYWYASADQALLEFIMSLGVTQLEPPSDAYSGDFSQDAITAVVRNDIEKLEQLISTEKEHEETTLADLLMSAVNYNRLKIAELLIEIGANPCAITKDNWHALKLAQDSDNEEFVALFESVAKDHLEKEKKLLSEAKEKFDQLLHTLRTYYENESNYEEVRKQFDEESLNKFENNKEQERIWLKARCSYALPNEDDPDYRIERRSDGSIEARQRTSSDQEFIVVFKQVDGKLETKL